MFVEFESHRLKFPKIIPDELLSVPRFVMLDPRVNVFEFVNKIPLTKVRLPLIEILEVNVTCVELLIVRLFTEAGNPFPVIWAVLAL
jgi:hypothetical protein